MARQQLVHAWCDVCLGEGGGYEQAQHLGVEVTVGRTGPLALDLCERHHKEAVQPVLDLLAKYGTPPGEQVPIAPRRSKARSGPFWCKVDGCMATPLKHTGTLWQHVKKHGLSMAEYRARYGEPVPLTPEEQASAEVEVRCQVPGCDTAYSTALGTRWPEQALVSHMWGRHAIKHVSPRA